jgi:hypothetical protein
VADEASPLRLATFAENAADDIVMLANEEIQDADGSPAFRGNA